MSVVSGTGRMFVAPVGTEPDACAWEPAGALVAGLAFDAGVADDDVQLRAWMIPTNAVTSVTFTVDHFDPDRLALLFGVRAHQPWWKRACARASRAIVRAIARIALRVVWSFRLLRAHAPHPPGRAPGP